MNTDEVRRAYNQVADRYHAQLRDELAQKPFDRDWLSDFARQAGTGAQILEIGTGDGHVGAFLAAKNIAVTATDLAPKMVEIGARAYPEVEFSVADIRNLPFERDSFDAAVSFYSIVNLEPCDYAQGFQEVFRILKPGGLFTLAFHIGDEKIRAVDWFDTDACLDFFLHPVAKVEAALTAAGLRLTRQEIRPPYASDVEVQTQRAYLIGKKDAR